MSRRALSIIVGVLGFVIAGLTVVGIMVLGSLFADARTANITGPGVDVFLRTPFPLEGGTVVLDVEARGGSRAGVERIVVRDGPTTLATAEGGGASWGSTISKGKGRGSETVQVRFAVPGADTLHLEIDVAYVVALSGGGTFSNDRFDDVVRLDVPVHSPSSRRFAQLRQIGLALGLFAVWLLIAWGVAELYARAGGDATETEGIGLAMGILGATVLGYWVFALRILNAVEVDSTLAAAALTAMWTAVPLLVAWKWSKRRTPAVEDARPRLHAMGVAHDAALPSALLLETSKLRLAPLVEVAPALATVDAWIDATLPKVATSTSAVMRRRIVALNWCLVVAGPALLRATEREELVHAICGVIAIETDEEREALAERVQAAVAAIG